MKKAVLGLLAFAQLLAVVGSWAWFHVRHPLGNLLSGDSIGRLLAWGRLAGLLAALAILFQLALVGRLWWVERCCGLDRLTRMHHILGFVLLPLLVLHPILVTLGHAAQADVGYWAQTVDFFKTWRGMLAGDMGLVLMAAAAGFSVLVLMKRLRYEAWYATHLALYIAFALAFWHQVVAGSDFADHPAFKGYWIVLAAFVLANLVAYRFARPVALLLKHRFVVERLVAESNEVTSVYIGGRDLSSFRVEAGQFLIVRFLAPGFRWEAHPFSVSCLPDGQRLRLSIKAVGDFTRRISGLKPGTPVLIDGPHGAFTSRACMSDNVLLIAGGIGITPVRALAEEWAAAGRDAVVIYANRSAAALVFKEELDALAARSQGKLRVHYVMSDDPAWTGETGRVDRERLTRLVSDLMARDVYLCGPPPMMRGVRGALKSLGFPDARLHDERFAL